MKFKNKTTGLLMEHGIEYVKGEIHQNNQAISKICFEPETRLAKQRQ